jgi:hypothetical protein
VVWVAALVANHKDAYVAIDAPVDHRVRESGERVRASFIICARSYVWKLLKK